VWQTVLFVYQCFGVEELPYTILHTHFSLMYGRLYGRQPINLPLQIALEPYNGMLLPLNLRPLTLDDRIGMFEFTPELLILIPVVDELIQ
jgi:hypothetical protein